MNNKKSVKFPDYNKIDTGDIVTFGTTVWVRKDGLDVMIIFPTGMQLHISDRELTKKEKKRLENL